MSKKDLSQMFAVLLPAAGTGSRFGGGDKLLVDLAGQSVLQRSVGLFARRADVGPIVIVTAPERFAGYREHLRGVVEEAGGGRLSFVAGGRERWESVLLGLRFLAAMTPVPRFVGIHDAARPLTPASVIDEAFGVTAARGAALPCVAEPCTLKRRGANGEVAATVDRRGLYQAQTPQCFDLGKLLGAFETLSGRGELADVTDDAQVFERVGLAVPITEGAAGNVKITTAGDVALARAMVAQEGLGGERAGLIKGG